MKVFLIVLFSMNVFAVDFPGGRLNAEVRKIKTGKFEVLDYNQASPPAVSFDEAVRIGRCSFRGKNCQGKNLSLLLEGILPGRKEESLLNVQYTWQGKPHELQVAVLPEDFFYFRPEGKSVLSKPLIFSAFHMSKRLCYLTVLSPENELKFSRRLPEKCNDFRPHEINGKRIYSYFEITEGISNVGNLGHRVILDENFHFIRRLPVVLEGHEFLLFDMDHWMAIEVELGRYKGGTPYLNKIIRERKNGKIIFEWSVADYFKDMGSELTGFAELTRFRGEVVAEVMHPNAIQILSDDRLLISNAFNGIILLDKKKKKVIWNFGGISDDFHLTFAELSLFIHSPYLDEKNSELYIFSNLSMSPSGLVTKVVKYKLNPEWNKVVGFENIRDRKETTLMQGCLQKTGDIYSICFGVRQKAPYDFIEMKGQQDTWKILLGDNWSAYRFYRNPYGEIPTP